MPAPNSLGTQEAPFTREKRGTLSALDDTVVLYAPNSASAVITLSGTFSGRISVTGSIDPPGDAIEGGRLLFQSGVGSIGDFNVRGDGVTAIDREYRILAGGNYIIVRATEWTSGEIDVTIHSQAAQNIVFINGPVHNTVEEAQRAGRAFSAGTGTVAVTNNNFLQMRYANPSDNDKIAFVTLRLFTNNATSNLPELSFFPTFPTPLAGATSVTPNNLRPDRPASGVEFAYRTSGTSLGVAPLQQVLPLNGIPFSVEVTRIMPPGSSFAYQIGGAGGGVNSALRIAAAFIWFEENIQ